MPEMKVTNAHLERDAYLYIRQSTPRRVLENIESAQRQYALRERAVALGKAGMIMGLEVSRLARNCADWHRLMELCEIAGTLIVDEDGLYDPALFNDKLLLGLKGELSQAELHFLKAQMRGGVLNRLRFPQWIHVGAQKGELLWGQPHHSRIIQILHNPRYAGAFVYGRTHTRRKPDGNSVDSKCPGRNGSS